MFRNKRQRKGQVLMIETIFLICVYLWLFGFMIVGFQLFYNKMVFGVAAYHGARTAIAYETDIDKAQTNTLDAWYTNWGGEGVYQVDAATEMVENIIKENCIAPNLITKPTMTIQVPDDNKIYFMSTVEADMQYLFPIIPAGFMLNGERNDRNSIHIVSGFTLARERIYD